MKKIFLIAISLLLLFVTGCKNCANSSPFLTEQEIKNNYNNFDITANFNGVKFRLIKTSSGYYYENSIDDEYIYYNRNTNQSFLIDNDSGQKILVVGNYDFSNHLNNIYYILTYHLSKEAIAKYSTKQISFLNRDVIEYSNEAGDVIEKYYIDKELGGCLYFLIDDGTKRVICQVESISFGSNLLEKYESYSTLENADTTKFITKDKVLNNLTSYDITFKIAEKYYHIIKSSQGFYYDIISDDSTMAIIYDNDVSQWYTLDLEEKTKIILNDTTTIEEQEETLLNLLLLSHLSNVTNNFYVSKTSKIVDLEVTEYLQSSIVAAEKYYVNLENGLCLKRILKISDSEVIFEVTSLSFNGDVSEYLNYEFSKNQTYQTYPSAHQYLQGIAPLEYGNFFVGYENEDGLTIIYKNFKTSFVDITINKFKNDYGFNIDVDENISYDTDYTYRFYEYSASRKEGYKINIQFDKDTEMLTFTISLI